MNVIIIAALALLVLIIIAIILSTQTNLFGSGTRDCANLGGICTILENDKCPANTVNVGSSKNTNCDEGTACCMRIFTDSGQS